MKKGHSIILLVAAVVIVIGLSVWYGFYWQSNTYFSTENAKVTANLYTITPTTAGKLVKLNVKEGAAVRENEVLARVENGPFLKSPVDGQVVKSDVVLNQVVSPSNAIAVIAEGDNIYVGANIEETDIAKIKTGQSVTVMLDAYPGRRFKGHVEEIDQVTQSALSGNMTSFSTSGTYTKVTQLIPVRIDLDEDVALEGLIGTNATVKIKVR